MSEPPTLDARIVADLGQHRLEIHRLTTQLDEALARACRAEQEAKALRLQLEKPKLAVAE